MYPFKHDTDVVLTVEVVMLLVINVLPRRVENCPEFTLRLEMDPVEIN